MTDGLTRRRFTVAGVTLTVAAAVLAGAVSADGMNAEAAAKVRHESDLFAVSGTSARDVWAVGYYGDAQHRGRTSYVRHWDGQRWGTVNSPTIGGGHLASVAAITPDDAWAVGASGYETANLAEHWDGRSWTQSAVPAGSGAYNRLTDVSFLASDYVLAVGFSNTGEDPAIPHRLLWNGRSWSDAPAAMDGISRIDAQSRKEAWAVGQTPQETTLAKHWDGKHWRTVKTPNVAASNSLKLVEVISPRDAWAVGTAFMDRMPRAFFEHWNGTRWTVVDSPLASSWSVVTAISAVSDDDIWASGYNNSDGFLYHWDGHGWGAVTDPGSARPGSQLRGVYAAAKDQAWSVGSWYRCAGGHFCHTKRILQRWDGSSWQPYDRARG